MDLTIRERIFSEETLLATTRPYRAVQDAHSTVISQQLRPTFRERLKAFHNSRSGTPSYQLGIIFGALALPPAVVSVVSVKPL